nr:hypothetical protein [Tanacetum cinerariifolium]
MEKDPNVSMDTVFNCVIPYIHDGDDRNSLSLVCRRWCELEENLSIDINPWIQEIAVWFKCLKSLQIRRMDFHDSDLELLARTRGKDLRVLKIIKCDEISTDGLLYIGKYCNHLRTLCLEHNSIDNKDGKWLHELAFKNTNIEALDCGCITIYDVKDLTLLANNCSQSLVSLKIAGVDLIHLVDVFRYAVRLEDFVGREWDKSMYEDKKYAGFKFPPNMCCLGIDPLMTKTSFPLVLPFAHQLRELHLLDVRLDAYSQCSLIRRCPNLEVLYTKNHFGDMGLQVIGQSCKKLRKFKTYGLVTQMDLINMAQGCLELECLHIDHLIDISNGTLECIGIHLKNLREFHMSLSYKICPIYRYAYASFLVDNGIRAMLIGCGKLERLSIHLRPRHGGLTDVGLGYIGKYGHNLRYLSLGYAGESDAGLVELSKGCPKLRKLEMVVCPFSEQAIATFVFNIHSLRYVWIRDRNCQTTLALTRPNS